MIDFSKPYEKIEFEDFLKSFLPDDTIFQNKVLTIEDSFKSFKKANLIAKCKSLENLHVIEIEHTFSENSRVTLSKEIFRFLSGYLYSNALLVLHNKKEEQYRLSFVESKLEWSNEKSVKREFSNPRRLSFSLGPKAKIHTPYNQLKKKVANFSDLKKCFDIEIVNNEFFENYKRLFLNLKNKLEKDKTFSLFLKEKKLSSDFFSKRLLGQIVFCYFLQKKKWLGVSIDKNFGTGDQNYLRNQFNICKKNKKNFFNDFLEYFFYQGLNDQNKDHFVKKINSKVPYIGGGLFEYFDGYDWENEILNIPNSLFSNGEQNGILDMFDLYNFTVDENEDFDIELAVDPEMLGRVFENLLPENIRKGGGSYYTPRSIVNYMCESSLIHCLCQKLKSDIDHDKIENFVKSSAFDVSNEEVFKINAEKIDKILESIKICDPAIGSGAFAVATVNLITRLRNSLKNFVNRKYKNSSYYFKRDCIQNSIYGVDIDNSAVEIAKLRLWLSLIVDEKDYNKTEILPNLDFQIIQGNSLINEIDGYDFHHLDIKKEGDQFELLPDNVWKDFSEIKDKFINLKTKYFDTKSYKNKVLARREIEDMLIKLSNLALSLSKGSNAKNNIKQSSFKKIRANKNYFLWTLFFIEIFQGKSGFDIIITNPPYIKERDNKEKFLEISKTKWGDKLHQGKMDFWYFFLHLSIELVRKNGIINFITSKYWLNSAGATKLIKRVKEELKFLDVVDIGDLKVFQNVAGHHMIHLYEKTSNSNYDFEYKKLINNLDGLKKNYKGDNMNALKKNAVEVFTDENEINFRESKIQVSNYEKLDEVVLSSQGLVQNPDKINKKNAEKYKLNIGDGVFVLSQEELTSLNLSKDEKKFVKPFYDERNIKDLYLNKKTDKNLLYITTENCKSISKYSNLQKHLSKFKKITEARRENISGRIKYFHLHWPRKEEFFLNEKIIIPSMREKFDLAYCDYPAYFGLGANVLIEKKTSYPIKFLFCILSSSFARYWLENKAKERGAGFDFSLKKIRFFPIKRGNDINKFIKNFDINKDKLNEFKRINNNLVFELYDIEKNLQLEITNFNK